MSDDTPTERFEPPTAPLPPTGDAAATPATATANEPDAAPKRGMLIALLAVGGAILLALIVLIVVLLGNGATDDSAQSPDLETTESATPTPTPVESESDEPSDAPTDDAGEQPGEPSAPPVAPQTPSFATFSGPNLADCADTSGSADLTWSWSSDNAVNAWFGIGTQNAKAEPFEAVPTTATYTFSYQCSEASQLYTVTLEDADGRLTHKTVTVTRD